MRRFITALCALMLLLRAAQGAEAMPDTTAAGTSPETPTATTAGGATGSAVEETTVHGTPPDLVGRWLAVVWIDLSETGKVSTATPWEIVRRGGKLELSERFITLPPAQKDALDKANAGYTAWEPSPADLADLRAAWDSLPSLQTHLARLSHEIYAPDGFDDGLKEDPRTKDAIWVVRNRHDSAPGAGALVRDSLLFAALAASDGGYTGNYDGVSVAASFMPLRIPFHGSFHLYRLEGEKAPAGWLARIFDLLRGCGSGARK